MPSFADIANFFSTENFLPHGHCYLWQPELLWMSVISDGTIALSYMMIPIALAYFISKRKDIPFSWVFILFCAFIFACGTTHMMDIVVIWNPQYWIAAFDKAMTAIISLTTALMLIKFGPQILAYPNREEIIRINKSLEKSEAKFRSFLEGAPDAKVITDKTGIIQIVNAQAEKIFGYDRKEMIGKKIEMLIPDRYHEQHEEHRGNFFENPHKRPMGLNQSLFGLRKDGHEFPVEISLSPVETEEGLVVLAAIRDVSDKKNIERLLMEKNVELVNADLAKDQFLTHMSHELRTPLNGIVVMTQMLMTTQLTDDQREQLNVISESNDQLLAVINQILDFSKVESGNIGVEQVDFNIRDLIHKCIAAYSVKANMKNISLNLTIQPAVPENVIGDAVKIRQIFTNILDNAVKFTEQGAVQVAISAHERDEMITDIRFEVKDSGIGISADVIPKLFKPFSQGDSSMTRKFGGTGLGLAITKRLLEVMGGSIEVESDETGSRFAFTVPIVKIKQAPKATLPRSREKAAEQTTNKSSGRVLFVEDNKLNQKTMSILLNKLGFSVMIANDGVEALKMLGKDKFDLILMDCQMPNMDGYKATMEIRRNEEGSVNHIPIIGVTAHAMEGSREKCLESGMDNYISKPFNISDLNKLIKKYLYTRDIGADE